MTLSPFLLDFLILSNCWLGEHGSVLWPPQKWDQERRTDHNESELEEPVRDTADPFGTTTKRNVD